LLDKGNKSSKLEKAEKMIEEGKELEIISEGDFLKML
jgi:DNA polymerase-3 subunit epsilon